jgi:hypothetical protein
MKNHNFMMYYYLLSSDTLVGNWLGSVVDNLLHFIDPEDGGGRFVQNVGNYTDVHGSASQQG